MLKNCLVLNQVVLPGPPGMWPTPVNLTLELQEVLLIDRIGPDESTPLLEVASTLRPPVGGQVLHWGLDAASLAREELYRLRRRIAYLTPEQVLLSRLTLGENIALGTSFREGTSAQSVLSCHADLLERLALQPFLPFLPHEVEAEVYIRALWAREFIKQPELIVAVLGEAWEPHDPPEQGILFLKGYLADRRGAALLLGQSLDHFHPLASRLLRWDSGRLLPHPLSEHQGRPLRDFLPLVPKEE
jgi:ABC-type ATPase involved in cell division